MTGQEVGPVEFRSVSLPDRPTPRRVDPEAAKPQGRSTPGPVKVLTEEGRMGFTPAVVISVSESGRTAGGHVSRGSFTKMKTGRGYVGWSNLKGTYGGTQGCDVWQSAFWSGQ